MDGGTDIVVDHKHLAPERQHDHRDLRDGAEPGSSFVFTNNILSYNLYGVFGDTASGSG